MRGRKDLEDLLQVARDAGWEVTRTGGGHYRVRPTNQQVSLIFISYSPSAGARGVENARAQLRRAGLGV